MVRKTKNENGSAVPAFLLKCYEMVDDQSTDALISWTSTGDSFVIWDGTEFASGLLPKYFKHNNLASFIRQLNIYEGRGFMMEEFIKQKFPSGLYGSTTVDPGSKSFVHICPPLGFRKVDTDRWEFANEGFIKGQMHLLKNISRRKQSQGLIQQKLLQEKDNDIGKCEENSNLWLWKEVESLKTDRNALMQELVKLRQHQRTSESKLLLLREQLQGMEKDQQQMLSFIVLAMQNPGFLVQLLQPKEKNWRMSEASKNVLKRVSDDHEPSEGMIVRYQLPVDNSSEPLHVSTSNTEKPLEFKLSSDEVNDLFMNIDSTALPSTETLIPSEHHGPVILPELPDNDDMLERLLSSPFFENNDFSGLDFEEPADFGLEMETVLSGS